jgi:hypothetical protein
MENWKNPPGFRTLKTSASTRSVSGISMRLMKAVAVVVVAGTHQLRPHLGVPVPVAANLLMVHATMLQRFANRLMPSTGGYQRHDGSRHRPRVPCRLRGFPLSRE